MENSSRGAINMFTKDCDDTWQRIKNRVAEIHSQNEEEEQREKLEGLARLEAAKQGDGSLALPVGPDGEGEKRAQVFAGFDRDFQGILKVYYVDRSAIVAGCGQNKRVSFNLVKRRRRKYC